MDKKEIIDSIAYCGLICKLCYKAKECDGCKSAKNNCGRHLGESGCYQRKCCIDKNINGCWECDDFPCNNDMYSDSHDEKIKAFARCIKEDGIEQFIDYVLENIKKGLDVKMNKDYDFKSEKEVLQLLRTGRIKME